MNRLSPEFWSRPFAHRGLHDKADGRVENSLSAVEAAIDAGYAIEIDVQPSADGEPMTFHDYELDRLTERGGRIDVRSTEELREIELTGGTDTIPTLAETLALIGGRAPLLLEVKDQSTGFVATDGAFTRRVCEVVRAAGHLDSVAIMSFNPFEVAHVRENLSEVARGVVSYDFQHTHDAEVDAAHRADLAALRWFEQTECDFVSYGALSLPTPRTAALREAGVPVFCWTIRSQEQADAALLHCDQITFEGYLPR